MPESATSQNTALDALSFLVFGGDLRPAERLDQPGEFWNLAETHHVSLRVGRALGNSSPELCAGLDFRMCREEMRVASAVGRLPEICRELAAHGMEVVVIKSLDHWPDLGSDLDLFTEASQTRVTALMLSSLGARVVPPALGDRLAKKVNFRLPGLKELVEIHFGRLGQTGEQVEIARRIGVRRRYRSFGAVVLPVPAPEEQILLAALQRMYRHFFFRVCDIANTARVIESERVDFDDLQQVSCRAGIWPGVATYLAIVSQYLEHYRGHGLHLPSRVWSAARFRLNKVYLRAGFLRVPLFPQATSLYTSQVTSSVRRGEPLSLRLMLLPPLAVAAGAKYKFTGDQGIW